MHPILPLRDRRQRFFRRALATPLGPHEPHAHVALDRANHIDGAADRPPAVARLLHEAEALEPAPLRKGRGVTAEAPTSELEAEQRKPVLQPQQADEPPAPGNLPSLAAERRPRAPQRPGIESGND